jgi:hypothetical protein
MEPIYDLLAELAQASTASSGGSDASMVGNRRSIPRGTSRIQEARDSVLTHPPAVGSLSCLCSKHARHPQISSQSRDRVSAGGAVGVFACRSGILSTWAHSHPSCGISSSSRCNHCSLVFLGIRCAGRVADGVENFSQPFILACYPKVPSTEEDMGLTSEHVLIASDGSAWSNPTQTRKNSQT